jgi:hypothetical protein
MTEDLSPIRREFEVRCSVEHAFDTWTRQMGLWWPPKGHSVSRTDTKSVKVEPQLGGRISETTRDGEKIFWGTVNIWEPPNRFGYLWHIGENDASEATQVIVTFTALDPARTRITIDHKGWENAGPKAGPRRRGNERGWDGLIAAFTAFMAARATPSAAVGGGRSSSEGGAE